MIRVLVVEDSAVVRELLVHILSADPEISIVGQVEDGEQALEAVVRCRPDVITMDIHMPRLDGLEATRRIMESTPTPIVIVSGSVNSGEAATTFSAMEAGALAVIPRPLGIMHPDHHEGARDLVRTVKLMSEVPVVRRWPRMRRPARNEATVTLPTPPPQVGAKVVAIGASTGGPPVLRTMLSELPKDFPLPLLIVQHMATGFIDGFVTWLRQASSIPVLVAEHGQSILPGHAYVAADGFHMLVDRRGRLLLTAEDGDSAHRPSVAALFRSVATVYGGAAVAVLLTGMGRDGANELKLLRDLGAITFAQDKATSVVHGMPGEAIRIDAAMHVMSPDRIVRMLSDIAAANK